MLRKPILAGEKAPENLLGACRTMFFTKLATLIKVYICLNFTILW